MPGPSNKKKQQKKKQQKAKKKAQSQVQTETLADAQAQLADATHTAIHTGHTTHTTIHTHDASQTPPKLDQDGDLGGIPHEPLRPLKGQELQEERVEQEENDSQDREPILVHGTKEIHESNGIEPTNEPHESNVTTNVTETDTNVADAPTITDTAEGEVEAEVGGDVIEIDGPPVGTEGYLVQIKDYLPESYEITVEDVNGNPGNPCIYDPGNGPRVKDFLAFMRSPFAAPQAFTSQHRQRDGEEDLEDDGDDGERIGEDAPFGDLSAANVLPILNKILPGELASILWYNRSRATHRVCPACQRIYHIGDSLRPLVGGTGNSLDSQYGEETIRIEQRLSGICSFTCFALSSYNYGPAAIFSYGRSSKHLEPETRAVLEGHGAGVDDQGLGYYVKVSRIEGADLRRQLGLGGSMIAR